MPGSREELRTDGWEARLDLNPSVSKRRQAEGNKLLLEVELRKQRKGGFALGAAPWEGTECESTPKKAVIHEVFCIH